MREILACEEWWGSSESGFKLWQWSVKVQCVSVVSYVTKCSEVKQSCA